jgi:superfamily II DNA/RNA helicase
VVPTRELAIQVAGDLTTAAGSSGTRVLTVYGGRAYEPQIEALRAAVDVVVGTPGRLLDLARQHHLDLSDVTTLVLDEADKMLDLGFLPDVERILQLTPRTRQTMLFSATMPGEVVTLARRHLQQPMNVRAEHHDEPEHVPLSEQHVFRAHQLDKIEMLARVLQATGRGLTMVFCRTKDAFWKVIGVSEYPVPQGRGHIRFRSHWKESQEKPMLYNVHARTKTRGCLESLARPWSCSRHRTRSRQQNQWKRKRLRTSGSRR